jgi:HD-like signal output (HDOD) protein
MSVNPELRSLDISIPAQPQSLLQLSLLLADENVNLDAVGELIERDMALAAAVLKAVNSSLYGLKGRVQTVQQAITYLGTREIVGIAYEMGLRAAFGPAAELEALWQRASLRGVIMGRLAQSLSLDAWVAHSAGLFEECGKAVLFRHAVDHYRAMLRAAKDDVELIGLERVGFGVSHDAMGAALCESWGLAPTACASVRHHVGVHATLTLPPEPARRGICVVSALAKVMMTAPEQLDDACLALAPQAELDEGHVLRYARRVAETLANAKEHARAA